MQTFRLRRPNDATVVRFLAEQQRAPFSYNHVGGTRTGRIPARGFIEDHRRAYLGQGDELFVRATDALLHWRMFELSWVTMHTSDEQKTAHVGQTVAMVVRLPLEIYSLNSARVLYDFDENRDGMRRRGFAYGTLPAHVEAGEEIFQITQNTTDGRVYYDLRAFSRPNHWTTRIGFPIARALQYRFGVDSAVTLRFHCNRRRAMRQFQ